MGHGIVRVVAHCPHGLVHLVLWPVDPIGWNCQNNQFHPKTRRSYRIFKFQVLKRILGQKWAKIAFLSNSSPKSRLQSGTRSWLCFTPVTRTRTRTRTTRTTRTRRTTPKYTRRKHPRGLKFGKKPHQTKPNSCNPPPYINPTSLPPDINPALQLKKKTISDPNFFQT